GISQFLALMILVLINILFVAVVWCFHEMPITFQLGLVLLLGTLVGLLMGWIPTLFAKRYKAS
ncbi:MAG: hypothetical protein K2X53_00285, partial [Alphaproteobacteria bacterium]|nr:hypothetical protein [Alphaproteobacteria bacterium]